jgi:hypothetical protein
VQPSHAGSHGQSSEDAAVAVDSPRNSTLVNVALHPQVNGFVSTWTNIRRDVARLAHRLQLIQPSRRCGVCSPGAPDRVPCTGPFHRFRNALEAFARHALHIATEGALGLDDRHFALKRGRQFTTFQHFRFPGYLGARFGLPGALTGAVMRRFHPSPPIR